MEALLAEFTLTQIITFVVLAAAAIKGVVSFFDWFGARITEQVHQQEKPQNIEKQLDIMENTHHAHIQALEKKDLELQQQLHQLVEKVDLLIESDKDDIKAWITSQYHLFMAKGSIDSYSLDCLERRYDHYKKENGNSFVGDLMVELRQLPKS